MAIGKEYDFLYDFLLRAMSKSKVVVAAPPRFMFLAGHNSWMLARRSRALKSSERQTESHENRISQGKA